MRSPAVDTVIFDLGNVLIRWNPRNLFSKMFGTDEAAMEHFLATVCHTEWNEQQDRGRSWEDATAEAIKRSPAHEPYIRAYFDRWEETLGGALEASVRTLQQLHDMDIRLLALTNWSHETFGIAEARFPFLALFEGIVVSGRERLVKPDPAIYKLIIDRYQVRPATTVFIDDSLPNVHAAALEGIHAIHFQGAEGMRAQLRALGIPLPADSADSA
ncbi:HAD family hydrolase [Pigmentiphaga aceris]|nr:HAD family phosphatase [Pigmentiphaga aceris]